MQQKRYKTHRTEIEKCSSSLSVITFNVNELNSPVKRQRWQNGQVFAETHFQSRDRNRLKVKDAVTERTWVAIIISDNVDFTTKIITGYKEDYFIMIKRPVH